MSHVVDLVHVDRCLQSALHLLETTSTVSPAGRGWHHHLDEPKAAPTATAIVMTAFHQMRVPLDRFSESLTLLRATQVDSIDPLRDGGWSTRTSPANPLMEATGLVARFLGLAWLSHVRDAPDAGRAISWLINNQNEDGGWGSHRGCRSRVWLTCLGLRALAVLNPLEPALADGVSWLMDQQDQSDCAWGEEAGKPSTITHTAFVLLTLGEILHVEGEVRLLRAFDWLEGNLNAAELDDRNARVEVYTVPSLPNDPPDEWEQTLFHCGLPIALSALLRHPAGASPVLVANAANTIIDSQIVHNHHDRLIGHWPSVNGGASRSLWSLWPCMQALLDLKQVRLIRSGDLTTWMPGAVGVQRATTRSRSLHGIVRTERRRVAIRSKVRRYWASAVLTTALLIGGGSVGLGYLQMKDYALSMVLPLALFIAEGVRRQARIMRATGGSGTS